MENVNTVSVTIERKHFIDNKIRVKVKTIKLSKNLTKEELIKEALLYASSSQIKLFGDSGMMDGSYLVTVTHIDGQVLV